jgi:hypothetical protein
MSADFLKQQNEIEAFIEAGYRNYMTGGLSPPQAYIDDFPDLDKYRQDFTLFFNFASLSFERETNSSENQETLLAVLLVVRNGETGRLREKLLNYAASFYRFFYAAGGNFDGIVDYGKIEGVTFFNAAEGQKNIRAAQIDIVLHNEI